ncbi:MAG: hypothetical protein HQK72_15380 [Desulfamplus sp.]|nr:hypothetical protein [Desulfamplus sp.]
MQYNSIRKDEKIEEEKEEHQKGADEFDANLSKEQNPVAHFFSWLKNIMSSNVVRSSPSDLTIRTQNQVRNEAKPTSTKGSSVNKKQNDAI